MKPADPAACGSPDGGAAPALEDLVPIAAVIGAGCEPCAERMVERALLCGSPPALVARTLGLVGRVSRAACLEAAVGPEVVERMGRSLRAGKQALRRWENGGAPQGIIG